MKIAIVNGPNINMLGQRDQNVYGSKSYEDLVTSLRRTYEDIDLLFYQSNVEGEIIDFLQQCHYDNFDGIVINAGAYTHYSYAIADCIADITVPCVEVHISNVDKREDFRKLSVIASNCIGSISGFGFYSYNLGLLAIIQHNIKGNN